jgi:Leucine-rich repeat (LRR) protein
MLLHACPHLEELEVTTAEFQEPMPGPWLLMDPDSTSWDTMEAPQFPLRSWKSERLPFNLLGNWLRQQPPGCPLTHVTMSTVHTGAQTGGFKMVFSLVEEVPFPDPAVDVCPLAAAPGLQTLRLDSAVTAESLATLRTLSALTCLEVGGWSEDVAAAVCALTGLRDLSLQSEEEEPVELPSSMSSLQQLSSLDLCSCRLNELPGELGVWLPRLEQLALEQCPLADVPASLTALTSLYLGWGCTSSLHLPTALSNLRELDLRASTYTSVTGLSSLASLEYLVVAHSRALGSSLAALQPLTRLQHLNLGAVEKLKAASFTVLGALQQLTFLGLAAPESKHTVVARSRVLARTEPLPALAELDLSSHNAAALAALGPWLGALTALTKLCMQECEVGGHGTLQHLPVQLRELDLRSCELQQLPPGLTKLTALEALNVSNNHALCQLPAWLSQLRRLETLRLVGTGVVTEQQVLARMPALRCVKMFSGYAGVVYGSATHLLWGHSSRFEED